MEDGEEASESDGVLEVFGLEPGTAMWSASSSSVVL